MPRFTADSTVKHHYGTACLQELHAALQGAREAADAASEAEAQRLEQLQSAQQMEAAQLQHALDQVIAPSKQH